MTQRILSTLALWGILIAALILGGPTAGVWIITLLSALSLYEMYRLLEKAGHFPMKRLGLTLGLLIMLGSFYLPQISDSPFLLPNSDLLTASILVCAIAMLREKEIPHKTSAFISTLFGIIYIPFMLKHLILLMHQFSSFQQGLFLSLWVVVTAKFSDVGGYLVGKFFGHSILAPIISPHKTWEGVLGAVIFSVTAAFVFVLLCHNSFPPAFIPWKAAIVAIPIALISILSDLVESLLKRRAGEEDSGNLVPGIGGVFDLLDSVILSAPAGYLIFKYIL